MSVEEKKEEGKDVVEKEKVSVPALRKSGEKGTPVGFEEGDIKTDLLMPRVAILQGLSQLVVDGKGQMGQLADSLSKEIFGNDLEFLPLYLFKTRVMFAIGKGLIMLSRNGISITQASPGYEEYIGKNCDELSEAQWQGNEPPKLSMVFNYPSLRVGHLEEFPISLSFMRTSAKAGKKLYSLGMLSGEDAFSRVYRLFTTKETNEKGTFAVAQVELARKATDEEYIIAKEWHNRLRGRGIEVDMEKV